MINVVNRSLPYYHGLLRSTLRSTLRCSRVNYGLLGSTRVKHVQTTHGNILQISAQKQCYIKSFFPSTIKEWNMLPIDNRNSRSLNVFERRFKLHFPSPIKMPWFSVGERFVHIHHTRIRIGCSKLKAHLHFNLHVEDDPSCRCGFGIENPYHFLFTCPLYAQIRVVMLDSISQIKPDIAPGLPLLLRGDINLTFDQNNFKHDQQPCTSERLLGVNVDMCVVHNIFLLCFFLL